jgi:hypothetical protein
MIPRFDAKAEMALRKAFTSVARLDGDPVESALAELNDRERTEALGLALMITGYVMVDVCDARWPNQASVRRIAKDLATTGKVARRYELDAGRVFEYLSQVVIGQDRVGDFSSVEHSFGDLVVVVAEQALVVYCPKGMEIWDYLDQIESAIEEAWVLKTTVLPAAVLRSYLPQTKAGAGAPDA